MAFATERRCSMSGGTRGHLDTHGSAALGLQQGRDLSHLPYTLGSGIFHCVSAAELFEQYKVQFSDVTLASAWFHGPGNGA